MKIAFILDSVVTCGGVLIPYQYVKRLRLMGYEADIYANGGNSELQEAYNITPKPLEELESFTENDIIIAVWWKQCDELEKYKGRKIQLVQGNDLKAYIGHDWKDDCIKVRNKENWEIVAVSQYAGQWIGRKFTIIPDAVDERFYANYNLERDIDVLIEGNDEPNKNIDKSIELAKRYGQTIGWLGRQTRDIGGVLRFTNPPQEDIPAIYQRAKIFLKLSESEGFCLPLLEAMASGCLVMTENMGGNDFCRYGDNCILPGKIPENKDEIIKAGSETAKQFSWYETIDKFLKFIDDK